MDRSRLQLLRVCTHCGVPLCSHPVPDAEWAARAVTRASQDNGFPYILTTLGCAGYPAPTAADRCEA
jgi:hypothetical protein